MNKLFVNIYLPNDVLKKELRVTETQYNKKYKKLGYKIVEEEEEYSAYEIIAEHEQNEEQNKQEYLESIPLSDMTAQQLRDYARLHDIDLSGVKRSGEARRIIREHMQRGM